MTGKRPQPRGGSRKGRPNKTTRLIKEGVVLAAEAVGADGSGKEGFVGYLKFLAQSEPKAFTTLLAKLFPQKMEVSGVGGGPINVQMIDIKKCPTELLERLAEIPVVGPSEGDIEE